MKYLCTLICAMLLMLEGNATIRRVGFTDVPPIAGVDYTTFFLAHQAASNGDTIYVWPGISLNNGWATGYQQNLPISKKLIIISKGSFLDPNSTPKGNSNQQATAGNARFGINLDFLPSSAGSVLMGFDGNGLGIGIYANNLTFIRNRAFTIYLPDKSLDSLFVLGNYEVFFGGIDNTANLINNFIIRNNFIENMRLPNKKYFGVIENNTWAFDNANNASNGGEGTMSAQFIAYQIPNIIYLWDGTWLFQNNLMVSNADISAGTSANYFQISNSSNATFNNNVQLASRTTSVWPTNGTGNVFVQLADVSNIFEAFPIISTSSPDSRYRLKANSPAKAGSTLRPLATVDAGMYGGPNPYKLSTIPSIPTIYNINSPTSNTATGNTIQINISTRSNN